MPRTLDDLLAGEKPELVKQAKDEAEATLLDIHLGKVRAMMEKTQAEMAEVLGVKQPSIAGMERAGRDIRLSSLKRYVEAGGGKVSLDISLPDGRHHQIAL